MVVWRTLLTSKVSDESSEVPHLDKCDDNSQYKSEDKRSDVEDGICGHLDFGFRCVRLFLPENIFCLIWSFA